MKQHPYALSFAILAVVLLQMTDGARQASAQTLQDQQAIQMVVTQFFTASAHKDLVGAMALWSRQSPDLNTAQKDLVNQFQGLADVRVRSLRVAVVVADGKTLWARVRVDMIGTNTSTLLPDEMLHPLTERVFQFVQEQGQWKIRRYGLPADIISPMISDWVRQKGVPEDASLSTNEFLMKNPLGDKLCKPIPGEKPLPLPLSHPAEPPLLSKPLTLQDQAQIADVVRGYFQAYARKDLEGCMAFYADASWEQAFRMTALEKIFQEAGPIQVVSLSASSPVAVSGYGVVRVHIVIHGNNLKSGEPYALFGTLDRAIRFVKTPQGWRIWHYGSVEQEVADELVEAKTPQIRSQFLAMERGHVSLPLLVSVLNTMVLITLRREMFSLRPVASSQSLDAMNTEWATVAKKPHPKVIRISDIALETANRTHDPGLLAGCYLTRAETALEMDFLNGDLSSSYHVVVNAQQALRLSTKANNKPQTQQALYMLAHLFLISGNVPETAPILEQLLPVLRQTPGGELSMTLGGLNSTLTTETVASQLGAIYKVQQRYSEALTLFEANLVTAQHKNDTRVEMQSRIAIGDCELGLNNPSAALEQYKVALSLFPVISPFDSPDGLWLREAEALRLLGRAAEAEAVYQKLLESAKKQKFWDFVQICELGIGDIDESQMKWNDAAAAYNEAILYSEQQANQDFKFGQGNDQNSFFDFWKRLTHQADTPYVLRAQDLLHLPDASPEELFAASEQAKARQLLNLIQNRKPDIRTLMTENERETEKTLDMQVTHLTLTLDQLQFAPKPDIAKLQAVQQQAAAARSDLRSYLHQVNSAVHDANRDDIARPLNAVESARIALLERHIGQLEDQKTSLSIEDLNLLSGDIALSTKEMRDTPSFDSKAFAASIAREKAFQIKETQIAKKTARLDSQLLPLKKELDRFRFRDRLMGPDRKKAEDQLRQHYWDAWTVLNATHSATPSDASKIAEAQKSRAAAAEAFQNFEDQLSEAHPELRANRERFLPAPLTQVNAKLLSGHPDLCVLSYLVGEAETLLLVLTGDPDPNKPAHLSSYRIIVSSATLADQVNRFRLACANPDSPPAVLGTQGRRLYDLLVAPADTQIAGMTHLVFVPDGVLHTLPFQATTDPQGRFLLERSVISYAPSVTALIRMRLLSHENRQKARLPMLAVGRPAFGGELPDLPATEYEARGIARLFHVAPLLKAQATRENVLSTIENSRYVHFATHGFPNQVDPMYSALALAHTEANGDRLLARDLMDLDLRADMVVMSACQTSMGRRVAGEGILGLTWALFVAGTPSTVSSLWSISDVSTSSLMLKFYEAMRDRSRASLSPTKPEALRSAQLSLLHIPKYHQPYYWAPFIFSGAW